VASDHAGVGRQVVSALKQLPGVVAASYSSRSSGFQQDTAIRGKRIGQINAAIELTMLSQADQLIQAGNRAASFFATTAAGIAATLPAHYAVIHPCNEEAANGNDVFSGAWPFEDDADCFEQLHPQPRFNMRWPAYDTRQERERVSCLLHDQRGVTQPLSLRLLAKDAMDLNCHDLQSMARLHGHK